MTQTTKYTENTIANIVTALKKNKNLNDSIKAKITATLKEYNDNKDLSVKDAIDTFNALDKTAVSDEKKALYSKLEINLTNAIQEQENIDSLNANIKYINNYGFEADKKAIEAFKSDEEKLTGKAKIEEIKASLKKKVEEFAEKLNIIKNHAYGDEFKINDTTKVSNLFSQRDFIKLTADEQKKFNEYYEIANKRRENSEIADFFNKEATDEQRKIFDTALEKFNSSLPEAERKDLKDADKKKEVIELLVKNTDPKFLADAKKIVDNLKALAEKLIFVEKTSNDVKAELGFDPETITINKLTAEQLNKLNEVHAKLSAKHANVKAVVAKVSTIERLSDEKLLEKVKDSIASFVVNKTAAKEDTAETKENKKKALLAKTNIELLNDFANVADENGMKMLNRLVVRAKASKSVRNGNEFGANTLLNPILNSVLSFKPTITYITTRVFNSTISLAKLVNTSRALTVVPAMLVEGATLAYKKFYNKEQNLDYVNPVVRVISSALSTIVAALVVTAVAITGPVALAASVGISLVANAGLQFAYNYVTGHANTKTVSTAELVAEKGDLDKPKYNFTEKLVIEAASKDASSARTA